MKKGFFGRIGAAADGLASAASEKIEGAVDSVKEAVGHEEKIDIEIHTEKGSTIEMIGVTKEEAFDKLVEKGIIKLQE